MRFRGILGITAGAIIALAVWPAIITHRAPAATFTPAPVMRDYLQRDALVAFEEKIVRRHPTDQITSRMLAGNYMNRFREQGDIGDVARSQAMAERSIELQPRGNTPAQMALASAYLTYHNFRAALLHERDAIAGEPSNASAWAQAASLEMELGEYPQAYAILKKRPPGPENPTWDSILARYDELTGHIGQARALIERSSRIVDADQYTPAIARSWYHMRAAQLAWEDGDNATADAQFKKMLFLYPDNYMGLMYQARFYRSLKEWHRTMTAAKAAIELYPLPQVLGYQADAQRALGDDAAAERTDALIRAEQRLFNVQGINDRLIANYYAQRGVHLKDALAYAKLDHEQRGNEIYADDTMGWVLGAMGRWNQARPYAEQSVRYDTQDPVLEYHAAIVALHTGHRNEALRRLKMALALNPHFHPVYAGDARREVAALMRGANDDGAVR